MAGAIASADAFARVRYAVPSSPFRAEYEHVERSAQYSVLWMRQSNVTWQRKSYGDVSRGQSTQQWLCLYLSCSESDLTDTVRSD